jgi:capsular polysaccharide transport system permease protein
MFGFHLRKSMPGVDYPMFLLTGMIPWLLFSNIVNRLMTAFEANRGLFNYRQVKPIDSFIARALVECLVYFTVFVAFMAAGRLLGFQAVVADVFSLCLIIAVFILFSFGFGLLCAVVGSFSENFKKVVGLIMRPLFFSSGIFFTISVVPEKFQAILLVNPLLHFLELIRSYYFETLRSPHANPVYVLCWTIAVLFLSLWLYEKLQKKILAS